MSAGERWILRAADPESVDGLRRLGEALVLCEAPIGEVREVAGKRVYLKGSHLRGSGARRHGLGRWFAGRRVPRDAEYHHLIWLREQGFEAPVPVGAGVLWRGLFPRYQWLATELVEDARPLSEALEDHDSAPDALLESLARDVARMHDLGFLHHDLFLRNLMVVQREGSPRIVFLDAWAGGHRRGLRGPSYDVACLLFDLTRLTHSSRGGLRTWLRTYLAARAKSGVRPGPFADAVDRDLRGLARKLKRQAPFPRTRDLVDSD